MKELKLFSLLILVSFSLARAQYNKDNLKLGRWQAKESGQAFSLYFSISSNEVRKAGAVSKNQQEVWNKVK